MDVRITFKGTTSLLLHNARLADPLDPAAKALRALTKKRVKSDEDHLEMRRVEHAGSLYISDPEGPYIPGEYFSACLLRAGRKTKEGLKVQGGLVITSDVNPLVYKGPRTVDGLWNDVNFRHMASVKVGQQRVMRSRPMFRDWAVEAFGIIDTNTLSLEELQSIADTAGALIGIGDWRPRFGRFVATVEAA